MLLKAQGEVAEDSSAADPAIPTRDLRPLPEGSGSPGRWAGFTSPYKDRHLQLLGSYLGPGPRLPAKRRGCPVPGPLAEGTPNRVTEPKGKHSATRHTGGSHVGRKKDPGGRGKEAEPRDCAGAGHTGESASLAIATRGGALQSGPSPLIGYARLWQQVDLHVAFSLVLSSWYPHSGKPSADIFLTPRIYKLAIVSACPPGRAFCSS